MKRRNFLSIAILGVAGLAALRHVWPKKEPFKFKIVIGCECGVPLVDKHYYSKDGKWTYIKHVCPKCLTTHHQGLVNIAAFEDDRYVDESNKYYQNSSCLVMMNQPKG